MRNGIMVQMELVQQQQILPMVAVNQLRLLLKVSKGIRTKKSSFYFEKQTIHKTFHDVS
jgi:hypothetical protein